MKERKTDRGKKENSFLTTQGFHKNLVRPEYILPLTSPEPAFSLFDVGQLLFHFFLNLFFVFCSHHQPPDLFYV